MTLSSGRGLLLGAVLLGALLGLSWLRGQPPAVRSAEAAPDGFSVNQALEVRGRLMEGMGPHRVGQPALRVLRDRLLGEFQKLGLSPQVQSTFACSDYGTCATVENLLVRFPGRGPRAEGRQAVMLAVHYDSVGAGPGVSDDANGTAVVLEVARHLKSEPARRNDILLLITDGEEYGLLGAHAFTRHPWANDVAAVVNVEARGSSGLSHMFETGPNNARLVGFYAEHTARPSTNSLAYAVYKRMPNDTDFTVFKAAQMTGLGIANIDGVVHYHTPYDDLAHSDPRTLQHHGDVALGLIRAMAEEDFSQPPPGDAAFVDFLGLFVLHWPVGWTPGIALLGLGLILAGAYRWAREEPFTPRQLGWASLGWWGLLLLCAGVGFAYFKLLSTSGAAPVSWIAHPGPALAALGLLWVSVFWLFCALTARRTTGTARWTAVWGWWGLLTVGLSFAFPDAIPSLLIPVPLVGLAAVLAPRGGGRVAGVALGTALAGCLLFPLVFFLMSTLGLPSLPLVGVLLGLVLASLLPLSPARWPLGWRLPGVCVAGAGVLSLWALRLSPYSEQAPQRLNIVYRFDQDRQSSRWALEGDLSRVPGPLAEFQQGAREVTVPWETKPSFLLPAESIGLTAPELDPLLVETAGPGRTLQLRLRSTRGASFVNVAFSPKARLTSVRVNGQTLPAQKERIRNRYGQWRVISCVTDVPQGCVVELSQEGSEPIEAFLYDESPGIPPGRFSRRAEWKDFVPSQNGDVTVASRSLKI
ncbi:M28 family peptidase [Stigmatella erecta]|uniref:Vacuolar membrane protease n=1 Tax=Stigmatella erecta TaxID=83460 RepID=A0A1I0K3Y1_9BACT|nr:M28 family peptidase [Stigmatella erecta]SEU18138.1 Peptidase family M28 [Stigmatella erecta]